MQFSNVLYKHAITYNRYDIQLHMLYVDMFAHMHQKMKA